jgi:phosphatidylglycerophosphate synthase
VDALVALLDVLATVPFALALFLVGAFSGWLVGGPAGAIAGAACGLLIGLWLDISDGKLARRLQVPVAISAVGILIYAFTR